MRFWRKLEDQLEGELHHLLVGAGDDKRKEQLKAKLKAILKDIVE